MDNVELKNALEGINTQIDAKMTEVNAQVVKLGEASTKTQGELESLLDQQKDMQKDVDSILEKQANLASHQTEEKTLGTQLVESASFKAMQESGGGRARLELKNTILTGGDNSVTDHDKLPSVIAGAFRQLTVLPTVASGQTSSNIVYFSRESAWTNNAAGQVEGAAKAESVLTFEEVSTPIRTIAHLIYASKQALDDSTFLASYIDRRMRHGVTQKVESQIINGDGTGQNFSGWLASGNFTATVATGTTDTFGLALKMKYDIASADYVADFYYLNPADWAVMEGTRRGTGDAAFVAASGAISYVNNGLTPMLWGLPVVVSNAVPAGTIICKSREADMYADRMSTVVEVFEQNGTNVETNLVTIRGEARGASLNFVPAAIQVGTISEITA